MTMGIDALLQPGPLVLLSLLTFAVIKVAAAIYLRPRRRKLLALVASLVAEDDLSKEDKAWLRDEVDTSRGMTFLAVSPLAPFAILFAIVVGVVEGWRGRGEKDGLFDYQAEVDRLNRDSDRVQARMVEIESGLDPRKGIYWNDKRRTQIADLTFDIETLSHPIAALWVFAWVVVASPLLVVGYLISGTIRPFLEHLWRPFRDPLVAALARSFR